MQFTDFAPFYLLVHTSLAELYIVLYIRVERGSLPQFLTKLGQPTMSTSEYWTRYTFLLLMGPKNIQIDELMQKTDPLDAQEDLQMKKA